MNPLVMELLRDLGTAECVQALEVDVRDISGDYDGLAFRQKDDDYLKYIGQVGC